MNEQGIDWKWAHLGSVICPGPDNVHGLHLSKTGKIHWNFEKERIFAGAQLVKIHEHGPNRTATNVSSWEHQKVVNFLTNFLQSENGPKQRVLVFRNASRNQPQNNNQRNQSQNNNQRVMNGNVCLFCI